MWHGGESLLGTHSELRIGATPARCADTSIQEVESRRSEVHEILFQKTTIQKVLGAGVMAHWLRALPEASAPEWWLTLLGNLYPLLRIADSRHAYGFMQVTCVHKFIMIST